MSATRRLLASGCLGAAIMIIFLLGGCGLPTAPADPEEKQQISASAPPTEPPGVPTIDPSAPPPSAPNAPTAGPSSEMPSGSGSTPPTQEQPAEIRSGSVEKVKVKIALYPVHRTAETSTVNLYISADNPESTFVLWNLLGDGSSETSSKAATSVDGIRMIDPVAKKAYLPAVTADRQCLCSPDDKAATEQTNAVWVTVVFAAPPTQLNAVNVAVPTFGTFSNVPLR